MFADVDTGVDDAMALVYLLASADADLVGIASTGGNVDVDQVCRNNLGLLQLCGATDIPVSRGADQPLSAAMRTAEDTHGPAGLGYAELPRHDRVHAPLAPRAPVAARRHVPARAPFGAARAQLTAPGQTSVHGGVGHTASGGSSPARRAR